MLLYGDTRFELVDDDHELRWRARGRARARREGGRGRPTLGLGTQDSATGATRSLATAAGGATPTPRLMVRDVTLRLRVKDVAAASKTVSTMAGAAGGYVESMQLATERDGTVTPPEVSPVAGGAAPDTSVQSSAPLGGYVTVRVPATKLTAFTRQVSGLGEVLYEATNAQDVTAEHVDMKARLANLKATEAQLRRLMSKANTIAEVLAVQRELTNVQGQIESLTAQLAALDQQVAMSAVTVELVPPTAVVSPSGDDWGFLTALRNALRAFVFTTNGIDRDAGRAASADHHRRTRRVVRGVAGAPSQAPQG